MSIKKKDVIRVGDTVKIINPEVVDRVGYPLTKAMLMEQQTPEQLKAIRDMFRAFGVVIYPENELDLSRLGMSKDYDRIYERVRYLMAEVSIKKEGWGGKEKKLYTYTLEPIRNKLATVVARRTTKTGIYHAGYSSCDYWGEYDYEPAYLSDEKTHVIYKLNVRGYGEWWSKKRNENMFDIRTQEDYKDIEIEKCNILKMTTEMIESEQANHECNSVWE